MKMSSREKLLLAFLGIIAFMALYYYMLFKPQMDKIAVLALENADLKQQMQMTEMEIKTIPALEEKLKELEKSVGEKVKRFYPEILQDRMIIIMDTIIKRVQLKSPSTAYSQINLVQLQNQTAAADVLFPARDLVEQYKIIVSADVKAEANGSNNAGGGQNEGNGQASENTKASGNGQTEGANTPVAAQSDYVQNMSITIQFSGSYGQVINFIKEIEALGRTVVITDIALANDAQNIVSGNIRLDFYALPKFSVQDKDYLDWPFKNSYGKTNPFVK